VSLLLFQGLALLIVVATLLLMGRRDPARLITDYLLLAAASYIGEESCIGLYGLYRYNAQFVGFVHYVPLMIPVIWPLVILSARSVVEALFGEGRHALVALLVVFDASLIEVLSVRAGYWSWIYGGHLNVPLIGILGWGAFVYGACVGLGGRGPLRIPFTLLFSFLTTHGLLLAWWWGGMRFLPRTTSDAYLLFFALLAAAALVAVQRARATGRNLGVVVTAPRLLATSLFVVLFIRIAAADWRYWTHLSLVGMPYIYASLPLSARAKRLAAQREEERKQGGLRRSPVANVRVPNAAALLAELTAADKTEP
jgi:hypothetical protein